MPTAARRAARNAQPAIHVQATPATTTVPSGAGKSVAGTNAPAAASQARPAPQAKAPTASKPAAKREQKAPQGVPIKPAGGSKVMIKDVKGTAVIMRRETVGTIKAPQTKIFTGEAAAKIKVGAELITHHLDNKAPCGTFTCLAVIVDGEVKSGKAPEGVKAYAVNTI
jgi:hypothetical protein